MASAAHVQEVIPSAAPPYKPRRRSLAFAATQWARLVRVLLTEYRTTFWIHLLFGLLMPLGMLFLMGHAVESLDRERAIFLLGGNLTTAVVFGPCMLLINKIGFGRHTREFDYWSALPLPKLSLILAMVTVSLTLSLPGTLMIYLLGSQLLDLPLTGGLLLLGLIPLGSLSLVGLGAFLGAYARDGQTANQLANLLMAFVTFLSPTLIPLKALPLPLQWAAPLTPIHYVANAFRLALAGQAGTDLAFNVAMMALFGFGFLWLAHRRLDWRAA